MSKRPLLSRLLVGSVIVFVALAGSVPLAAQSKQALFDELTAIGVQLDTVKADPSRASQVLQLLQRQQELRQLLGQNATSQEAGERGRPPAGPPPLCLANNSQFNNTIPSPINDLTTTSSTIVVSGVDAYLSDLDVITDITHTFAADLDITLTSPAGTVVTLSTGNGGGSDDVFSGTTWDDSAGAVNPPGAVTDATFANLVTATPLVPEEAFGAFIGEDPNGTWQLDIFDDAGGDVGSLNSWSLDLTTLVAAPNDLPPVVAASADTPLAIPDSPGGPAVSTITVSGAGSYLSDLDVITDITHTWAADLEVTLTSPAGTVVTLTTNNGGSNDDVFSGTTWDDSAGAVNPPGAVTDATFANLVTATPLVPEEALAAVIGEDPNGVWSLEILDDAGLDVGTLNSWSLSATTCSCSDREIPTVRPAGLVVLGLILALSAVVVIRRLS